MKKEEVKHYPLVSVYTCVYNRAHTIHRVFESMKRLDYPNIEHVIINDGSTDNLEELVEQYKSEVSFSVKYHKKPNGGKHTALNVAWEIASGEFMIQLDSDDELLPHSVRFLVDTYFSIPEEIRSQYWCVHGRLKNQHGDFVGDKYPDDINEKHWREAGAIAAKSRGDKNGLQVRKYLAPYRFPEVVGTWYVPEGIVWKQINAKYGTWYTNEIVGIYYVNEGGNLTAKEKTRKQMAAMAYYNKWKLMHQEVYGRSLKDLLCYSLLYFVATKEYRQNNKYLDGLKRNRFILVLLAPFAALAAVVYRKIKKVK